MRSPSLFYYFCSFVVFLESHRILFFFFFFLNDPPPPEIYPLPLHDALPIYGDPRAQPLQREEGGVPPPAADHVSAGGRQAHPSEARQHRPREQDRRPDPGVDPARGADEIGRAHV